MVITIAVLIVSITSANNQGFGFYKLIFIILFALLMGVILYKIEENIENPIITFSLFKNRRFICGIIANFFLAFFYCLAFFLMPLYLHVIRGEVAYTIGLMLLPTTTMVALVSPIVGRVIDRKGPQKPLLWGFAFFTLSAILQANFTRNTLLLEILAAFVLMGIAWGLIVGPSTILSISALSRDDEALAIGTSWTLHNIGGSTGLSLGVAIYDMQFVKNNNSFICGYQGAMLLLVFSSIFAFLFLLWNFRHIK